MASRVLASSPQSPVANSEIKETPQAPSSSKLSKRINPLVEPDPSVQFWQGRDVAPTTDVKAILNAYYSYQTVRNNKGIVEYHITASSDKGDGRLPPSQSDWTLKIYNPTMEQLFAQHKIKVPHPEREKNGGFKITGVTFVGKLDFIIVKISDFEAFNVYCFNQSEGILTENFIGIHNPTFLGTHLISWYQSGYPHNEHELSCYIYDLDGKFVKGPLVTKDSNHLWIDSKMQRIFVGLYHAPNWPRACYDVNGKRIQL